MIANPPALKRVYDAVAFFAVLNVAVVGGFCAYLLGTGVVDGDKLRGIADVLRTEEEPEDADQQAADQAEQLAEAEAAPAVAPSIQATQMSAEVLRREAERVKVELDQKVALTNSILLRVSQERDNFKREREEAAKREAASNEMRQTAGFEKQVELYEAMAPKTAIDYLLDISDPDEAARIIIEMDARKAKKVIEAAKQPDQIQRMKGILKRLREVAPDKTDELEGTGT